jgi:hypothetical protein
MTAYYNSNYVSRFGDEGFKNQVINLENFKYVVFPVWIKNKNTVLYYNIPVDWTLRDFVRNVKRWILKDLSIVDEKPYITGVRMKKSGNILFLPLEETNITIQEHLPLMGDDFNACIYLDHDFI